MNSLLVPTAPAAMATAMQSSPYLQVPAANIGTLRSPAAAARLPAIPKTTVAVSIVPTFPMTFYLLPTSASAKFSTNIGQFPKRRVADPLPAPVVRSNMSFDVGNKAAALEAAFPRDLMRSVTKPRMWTDLYEYFDGYDLYVDGVAFCWHVIMQIANRNEYIDKLKQRDVNNYAAQWVMFHKDLVVHCQESDLISQFTPEECKDLDGIQEKYLDLLRERLQFYRNRVMRQQQQQEREAYEKRLPPPRSGLSKQLYPVAEVPYTTVARDFAMQPGNARQTGNQILPQALQPVLPGPYNFNTFPPQRPRVQSDASRAPRVYPRLPEDPGRSFSQRGTPSREDHFYNGPQESPSKYPTQHKPFERSNDARNLGGFGTQARQARQAEDEPFPFSNHPQAIAHNGTSTFFYIGPPKKTTDDKNNRRTVWVGHVDIKNLYVTHQLKDILSEVGDVESIHFPQQQTSAFAVFMTEDAATKAIFQLHGMLVNDNTLSLGYPRQRDRSNSNISQKGAFGNQMGYYPPKSRRPSVGPSNFENGYVSSSAAGFPPRAGPSVAIGLQSQIPESTLHRAAIKRMTMPLSSVENLPQKPQVTTEFEANAQYSVKKEKSPIKISQDSTPVDTPKKELDQTNSQRGGKNKKGRGNKQNTSTRPTPASTPSKSMSYTELDEMFGSIPPPQMGQQIQAMDFGAGDSLQQHAMPMKKPIFRPENDPSQIGRQANASNFSHNALGPAVQNAPSQAPKKKNKKKKTSSSATLSKSPSFATESSEVGQSPRESGTSESRTTKSPNTSTSNNSSRKPSLTSGRSDTSLLEMSTAVASDGNASKQRVASGKGRKSNNRQNHSKKESDQILPSQSEKNPQKPSQQETKQEAESKEAQENANLETREKAPSQQKSKQKAKNDDPARELETNEKVSSKEKGNQKAKDEDPAEVKPEEPEQKMISKENSHSRSPSKEAEQKSNKNKDKEPCSNNAEQQSSSQKTVETKAATEPEQKLTTLTQTNQKENEPPRTSKKDEVTVVAGSQRKADAKGGKSGKKSSDASKGSQNSQGKKAQSSPMPALDDSGQWPTLGPCTSPQSAIIDGKPPQTSPPLVMQFPLPYNKAVIPAVPLSTKKPRPHPIDLPEVTPPEDETHDPPFVEDYYEYPEEKLPPTPEPVGGPDWPFVKSFRESSG